MEKRYKGIFFDLDGTLINTAADLTDAVNYVRELFGLEPVLEENVIAELGNGIINLLKKFLSDDIKEDDFIRAYGEFIGYYNENSKNKTRPYDGTAELLVNLRKKGYRLAVVTNKNDDAAKELTEHFFPGVAEHIIGRTEDVPKKPDPTMMHNMLQFMGLRPEEVLFVGDSEVDGQFGANAGVDTVLVSWGFRSREHLESFSSDVRIIDRPEEIFKYL